MTLFQALGLYNYWVVVFLMMTGFYIVIARRNFVKSVLGLNIFQTSVFLLYITMGKIKGATAPIVPPDIAAAAAHHGDGHHGDTHHGDGHHGVAHHGETHAHETATQTTDAASESAAEAAGAVAESATGYVSMTGIDADHIVYSNPLPSVLMLTAIVVGIATTALALALIVRVREDYGTIEEDEILRMNQEEWAAGRQRAAEKSRAKQGGSTQ